MRLSVDNINQNSPYWVIQLDEMTFRFVTKNGVVYRVGFYDNIIGQDRMSLYVEIGFGKDQLVGEIDGLLQRTLDNLHAAGIVTDQKLVAEHHVLMDPAYVHITKQSEVDKKEKMEMLAQKDIYSIGRYGAWKYCSLEDNMHDAFTLAEKIK